MSTPDDGGLPGTEHPDSIAGSPPEPDWLVPLMASLNRPIGAQDRARAAMFCVNVFGNAMAGLGALQDVGETAASTTLPESSLMPAVGAERWLTLVAALDLDDIDLVSLMRPSATVVSAVLALAPAVDMRTTRFLEAIIRGYECGIRVARQLVADAAPSEVVSLSAHAAAALAAGAYARAQQGTDLASVMREVLARARAASVIADNGTPPARALALRKQGMSLGLDCLMTAEQGATRPGEIPIPMSFVPPVTGERAPDWLIHEASVRPWRVHSHVQPVLDAALRLLRQPVTAEEVAELRLVLPPGHLLSGDLPTPSGQTEISASLQMALAFVVLRGEPQPGRYLPLAEADQAVRALAARVVLQVARPDETSGVRLALHAGQSFQQTLQPAWGSPDNPLTAPEMIARAQRIAVDVGGVPAPQASRLIQAAISLMQDTSLDRLFKAIAEVRRT